jgi:flavin reductase
MSQSADRVGLCIYFYDAFLRISLLYRSRAWPDDVSMSPDEYIRAMRSAATGVTVVATDGPGGRFAQTVSAMCSVSARPPLVLACIKASSPAGAAIRANGVFCVNVLATQHRQVADSFAGRSRAAARPWDFGCCRWETSSSGSPRVADAVASFDCIVHQLVPAGTHIIYIGQVEEVTIGTGVPLVYSARTYSRPEPFGPPTLASAAALRRAAVAGLMAG